MKAAGRRLPERGLRVAQRQATGSFGAKGNFDRLVDTYGPTAVPPVTDAAPFVANDVFNKVAILASMALVAGIGAAFLKVPPALAFVAVFVALGFAIAAMVKPSRAATFAPLFAITEGIALGWVSRVFSSTNGAVVPLAIIGTSVVFLAVLASYRTGLVKVGPTFVRATLIAGLGLLAMMIASMFGLKLPFTSQGTSTLIIFGVLYLIVGVMDLFVDFAYVYKAQQAGVSKDGEWFAALSIMFSVVMIYLALLRIFGGR